MSDPYLLAVHVLDCVLDKKIIPASIRRERLHIAIEFLVGDTVLAEMQTHSSRSCMWDLKCTLPLPHILDLGKESLDNKALRFTIYYMQQDTQVPVAQLLQHLFLLVSGSGGRSRVGLRQDCILQLGDTLAGVSSAGQAIARLRVGLLMLDTNSPEHAKVKEEFFGRAGAMVRPTAFVAAAAAATTTATPGVATTVAADIAKRTAAGESVLKGLQALAASLDSKTPTEELLIPLVTFVEFLKSRVALAAAKEVEEFLQHRTMTTATPSDIKALFSLGLTDNASILLSSATVFVARRLKVATGATMMAEVLENKNILMQVESELAEIDKATTDLQLFFARSTTTTAASTSRDEDQQNVDPLGKAMPLAAFNATVEIELKQIADCVTVEMKRSSSAAESRQVLQHFAARLETFSRAMEARSDDLYSPQSKSATPSGVGAAAALLALKKRVRRLQREIAPFSTAASSEEERAKLEEILSPKLAEMPEKEIQCNKAIAAFEQCVMDRSSISFESRIRAIILALAAPIPPLPDTSKSATSLAALVVPQSQSDIHATNLVKPVTPATSAGAVASQIGLATISAPAAAVATVLSNSATSTITTTSASLVAHPAANPAANPTPNPAATSRPVAAAPGKASTRTCTLVKGTMQENNPTQLAADPIDPTTVASTIAMVPEAKTITTAVGPSTLRIVAKLKVILPSVLGWSFSQEDDMTPEISHQYLAGTVAAVADVLDMAVEPQIKARCTEFLGLLNQVIQGKKTAKTIVESLVPAIAPTPTEAPTPTPANATAPTPATAPATAPTWLSAAVLCDRFFVSESVVVSDVSERVVTESGVRWLAQREMFLILGLLMEQEVPETELAGDLLAAVAAFSMEAADCMAVLVAAFILLDDEARKETTYLGFVSNLAGLLCGLRSFPQSDENKKMESENFLVSQAYRLIRRYSSMGSKTKVMPSEAAIGSDLDQHSELEASPDIICGKSLLHLAVEAKACPALIKLLIQRGKINVNRLDIYAKTAAQYTRGDPNMLQLFLPQREGGPHVNVVSTRAGKEKKRW